MSKRQRGRERDGPRRTLEYPQQEEHCLYLILDDDPWGYNIRKISLSPPSSSSRKKKKNTAASGEEGVVRRLPEPVIFFEAHRGRPWHFAAIGTKIVMTQYLNPFPGGHLVIPIYDVRRRGVTFGPGKIISDLPIYIPVGDKLYDLDSLKLSRLSFEPRQPPPLDYRQGKDDLWSWHQLPPPPFDRADVNSYAVHADGQTILISTDIWPDDPYAAAATFTFDTRTCEWERHGDWTLPFTGRAYFVRCLEVFVGLSKDPASLGHLASCDGEAATRSGSAAAWKLGKEKLFSDDPAETHVNARLVYTGSGDGGGGNEFCLVECVSVKLGNGELEEPCYRYRLTTFSVSYDDNGDLTIGETSWLQRYEVPRETSQWFMENADPVVFWL